MKYQIYSDKLDAEIYHELRESVDWNNWSKAQAKAAIDNSYYAVSVWDGDRAIGMGRIIGDGIYFTIVDVVVRPEYQGKQIGSLIVNSLVSYVENEMKEDCRICIQLIAAVGKEAFYIKQGFKLVPNENCGSSLQKLIFT